MRPGAEDHFVVKMTLKDRHEQLLARRIQPVDIEIGRAYIILARNGGVGVAVKEGKGLGYRLHRKKFGNHYLDVEDDWNEGPPFGTAIPIAAISEIPPKDAAELLAWLSDQETKHRAQIDEAWQTVIGHPVPQ